ncbi:MAG: hypothetical protein V4456_16805 [Bacteroidota bacterium]
MREHLDLIFYRMYRFQVTMGNGQIAVFSSVLFLTFLEMINVFTLTFFLYALKGIAIPFQDPIRGGLSIFGALVLFNFLLFTFKKRDKIIVKKYKHEPAAVTRSGNIKVVAYILVTFVLMGLGFYLMILRNRGQL